jgi:hypothetical protein
MTQRKKGNMIDIIDFKKKKKVYKRKGKGAWGILWYSPWASICLIELNTGEKTTFAIPSPIEKEFEEIIGQTSDSYPHQYPSVIDLAKAQWLRDKPEKRQRELLKLSFNGIAIRLDESLEGWEYYCSISPDLYEIIKPQKNLNTNEHE